MHVELPEDWEHPMDFAEAKGPASDELFPGGLIDLRIGDSETHPVKRELIRRGEIFLRLGLTPDCSVMEVGAESEGFTLAAVASIGADYRNLDTDRCENKLDRVVGKFTRMKQRYPHLGDVHNMYMERGFQEESLKASTVDYVVMLGVLERAWPQGEGVVLDMLQQGIHVLKPGGFLVLASKRRKNHEKIEAALESLAAKTGVVLRKIGRGMITDQHPVGSVYRLESK